MNYTKPCLVNLGLASNAVLTSDGSKDATLTEAKMSSTSGAYEIDE